MLYAFDNENTFMNGFTENTCVLLSSRSQVPSSLWGEVTLDSTFSDVDVSRPHVSTSEKPGDQINV